MGAEHFEWVIDRFIPQYEGRPFLEVNDQLVPITLYPNSYATRLRQPVYGDEEEGFVAEFPDGYTLPRNAKFGRLIIGKKSEVSLN